MEIFLLIAGFIVVVGVSLGFANGKPKDEDDLDGGWLPPNAAPYRQSGSATRASSREKSSAEQQLRYELTVDVTSGTAALAKARSWGFSRREKAATSQQCWVPRGKSAEVGGRSLGDGFIYVGKNLSGASEWGERVEPALIDPSLRVEDAAPNFEGEGLNYWPSYHRISAASRAAYLRWLGGGRDAPDADIGYVFLYFYGIERRILSDARTLNAARKEIPALEAEVERLLGIYGSNASFSGYATRFLDFLRIHDDHWQPGNTSPPVCSSGDVPIALRAGVGHMALHGQPMPASWALSWVYCDPEIALRTPARRCDEEFETLFQFKYGQKFGEGLRLKTCKRKVAVRYWPASRTFSGSEDLTVETPYPDVMRLVGPRRKLEALVAECTEALDPLSRWLGRNPEGRDTLLAASVMPLELLELSAPEGFAQFRDELRAKLGSEGRALLPALEVLSPWFGEGAEKLTKKQCVEAAHLLARAGLGFEPDVRFCGQKIERDGKVVLFEQTEIDRGAASPEYTAAVILLHFSTMVSAADGIVVREEKEHLHGHLVSELGLDACEVARLGAYLDWLIAHPPTTLGGKKRLEKLSAADRQTVGEFLVSVAWADGRVAPEEVKMLTRVFKTLGLDPANVHGWLHDYQVGADPGPVTVARADPGRTGFALPSDGGRADVASPDRAALTGGARVRLNPAEIAAKLRESELAAATLVSIFADEEPEPAGGAADGVAADVAVESGGATGAIEGLDVGHSNLLRRLAERPTWPRAEYEQLAESLGLLPHGALDQLNDAAFELCDEPVVEGEETLEIMADVAEEMLT